MRPTTMLLLVCVSAVCAWTPPRPEGECAVWCSGCTPWCCEKEECAGCYIEDGCHLDEAMTPAPPPHRPDPPDPPRPPAPPPDAAEYWVQGRHIFTNGARVHYC